MLCNGVSGPSAVEVRLRFSDASSGGAGWSCARYGGALGPLVNLLRQGPDGEEVSSPLHLLTNLLTLRIEGGL